MAIGLTNKDRKSKIGWYAWRRPQLLCAPLLAHVVSPSSHIFIYSSSYEYNLAFPVFELLVETFK